MSDQRRTVVCAYLKKNHKTAYFTFTMWGISEWKGIEKEKNISTWLEIPVNVITSQHLCFELDLLEQPMAGSGGRTDWKHLFSHQLIREN